MTGATPDLRRDPVTGLWSVITPGRTRRPVDEPSGAAPPCPFCAGNEALTPPEVDAVRPAGGVADGPGWTLRVVPNKFPIVAGGHEVIIHSPRHETPLHELSVNEVTDTLAAAQRRLRAHADDGSAAGLLAVNQGQGAGASLAHPHAQLFALPVVPPALAAEVANFAGYAAKAGGCLLCDILTRVRAGATLLVADDDIVAWAPDASRYPFEVWLAPVHHGSDFRRAGAATLAALATTLQRVLAAVDDVTGGAPLNWWLHTAPFATHPHDDRSTAVRAHGDDAPPAAAGPRTDGGSRTPFHWHVEIAPRTTALAGFELGAGMAVDVVEPREAAARLVASLAEQH